MPNKPRWSRIILLLFMLVAGLATWMIFMTTGSGMGVNLDIKSAMITDFTQIDPETFDPKTIIDKIYVEIRPESLMDNVQVHFILSII